ncbi:GNAT family N-acetyltransferase [Stackebrandtia soli]|uniref:GNAT family N-acetyltransferase n=1 Tax=Stackebrandtia soli TaxID=1892856 RepID=UPI0039E815FA
MALGYVRPARAADAADIGRIQLTTWRAAYDRIVPESVLSELDEAWLAEQWEPACAQPPSPAHRVFVAIEQAESDPSRIHTIGFAAVEPDPDDATAGTMTELLVEPRFGRRGHGSRLLAAAVAHWREHGVSTASAWAFTRDSATLAFYKSAGWAPDGVRRTLDMAGTAVPQLRLHTNLDGADTEE